MGLKLVIKYYREIGIDKIDRNRKNLKTWAACYLDNELIN